jgi:hypothetical protein
MPDTVDKQWGVFQDGQPVTGPLNEAEAKKQADERRQKLPRPRPATEAQGGVSVATPTIEAKQFLYGAILLLLVPVVSMCAFTFTN